MRQAVILKIMILLALVQAMASLLRALDWMQIGVDLFGEGILLLPFIGAVVFVHGCSSRLWHYCTPYLFSAREEVGPGGVVSSQP